MNKDEFVKKYLSCKSEAEKALLLWDLSKIHRAEKLDETLAKAQEIGINSMARLYANGFMNAWPTKDSNG